MENIQNNSEENKEIIYKVCKKCCNNKPLKDFYKHKNFADGHKATCKVCELIQVKEYYKNNKESIQKTKKKYRIQNKEKIRKQSKEYNIKNNNKIKLKNFNYRKNNKEKIKEYFTNKRNVDFNYKIKIRISGRIREAFKRNKYKKSEKGIVYLGCSITDYVNYLTPLLKDGMTFDNYGKTWEIDHIIPIIYFDISNPEEAIKGFNWSNTQPLLKEENHVKNRKLPEDFNMRKWDGYKWIVDKSL